MNDSERLTDDAFVARLRAEGGSRYHDRHPFHVAMHEGRLSKLQLQAWVRNRYYYQTRIPIKDALIVSKSEDPGWRRRWMRRIVDHDGVADGEGGLASWMQLVNGVGLVPNEIRLCQQVAPGVRFACDAYVTFVREHSLLEAVASSLTEFFSPDILARRVATWEQHYTWVDPAALGYFRTRGERAKVDSREAIDFVIAQATTRAEQERCVAALILKTEILWSMLDGIAMVSGFVA